jgi:hypothetical protein
MLSRILSVANCSNSQHENNDDFKLIVSKEEWDKELAARQKNLALLK